MRQTLLALLTLLLTAGHPDQGRAQSRTPLGPTESTSSAGTPKVPGSFLTLDAAIRIGLATHPLLDQMRYAALAFKAITKQAQGDLYPWLEASVAESSGALRIITSDGKTVHDSGGHGFDPGGALPHHNQNMLTGGLLLNQLITDFGHTAHRILAAKDREAAAEKETLTNKALVILDVQRTYLNCLMQQRLMEVAAETLKRRQAVRDLIQTLFKHQLKSKLDLDLIQVEVSNAELVLTKTRNDLAQAFASLNHAMGIKEAARYELERISVQLSPPAAPDALVAEGLQHRPELLGGRDQVAAMEELVKAAKALNFGSVSAVGTIGLTKYGTVHDGGIPSDGLAPLWGAGATAQLPLFTGFQIQNRIKEAAYHKRESEQELQNLVNEVMLQIIRAYLSVTTNAEQIPLEQDRVAFAAEALSLAQERYKLGLNPIVEVIRATTALFSAEARLVQAQYIYKTSEAALAYATGQAYQRY